MMKFKTFVMALLVSTSMPVVAQTLIDEGFEDVPGNAATTVLPSGWERIGSYAGNNINYRWAVQYSSSGSTMSGHKYAMVDAPTWADPNAVDAYGPRRELLLTPAVALDGTYQLAFDWEAAAYSVLEKNEYTLKVGIVDVAAADTTVIFDITNEQQVRDSGVPADIYGSYIWTNWAVHTSKLDLSPWQGKTVKVAFIYDLYETTGNVLYLDNISIKQHEPETGPIAELSQTTYRFPTAYLGEKLYSEIMTLKNVGLRGLKVTGFEAPEAFGLAMDTVGMSLGVNETARFQIYYKASLMSPVEADVVLKTNGGDAVLHVEASKQAVPEGYELELFEGAQFPPAGWQTTGSSISLWGTSNYYALEGDKSMYSSPYIEESQIVTPRLDLSSETTPAEFMFTYYALFNGEDVDYPANDLLVQVCNDGSNNFRTVWTADYTKLDTLINVSVDLSPYRSDDVRVRLVNTACYYDSEYGMDDGSTFIIDRVLLPGVYGVDGAPLPTELVSPADSTENVYPKQVKLSWKEAQFAEGYRLYVGKATDGAQQWDVCNGIDVADAVSYTIPILDYSTTYAWTVVPYNSIGDGEGTPTWVFTTQDDQSIAEFPWSEGFESGTFAPLGWLAEGGQYTRWSASDYYPYEGRYSALAFSNETEVAAVLTTPDITIPADGALQLSFWWGNDRPVNLINDAQQVHVNHSTADDGIDAVMFDIQVDGEWHQLRLISDNAEGVDADGDAIRYWVYETVDLTPYAGKVVAFRWRYISHNYNRSRGGALDNVKIDVHGAQLSFSVDNWNAYKVNHGTSETSPLIAVTNLGSDAVTIENVQFTNPCFTTTLRAGDVVESAGSKQFTVTFNAGHLAGDADSVSVDDALVLTLSDGTQGVLPVSAIALASDIHYYGFEHDATGECPAGFTAINADGQAISPLSFWNFPNNGMPLAFFTLNDSQCYNSLKEPHGHQSLMTRCTNDGTFDDWIVSAPMVATSQSKFEFDMRTWESENSVLPAGGPTVQVLVSTTSPTDRSSFVQVGRNYTADLYNNVSWPHLSYDLSRYDGQRIFVALRAFSDDCLGGFYDNFEFVHFGTGLDVNGDGVVDIDDVNEIINVILQRANNPRADVDGNGVVEVADMNIVISYMVNQ